MGTKNYKTGEIEKVTSRKMFVQYGEERNYPISEWKELLSYKIYQGSRDDLYTWAMYLVPKDAKDGERFYIEDTETLEKRCRVRRVKVDVC